MNILRWLLYGPDPDADRLDRLAQARPRRMPLARLAERLSEMLGR